MSTIKVGGVYTVAGNNTVMVTGIERKEVAGTEPHHLVTAVSIDENGSTVSEIPHYIVVPDYGFEAMDQGIFGPETALTIFSTATSESVAEALGPAIGHAGSVLLNMIPDLHMLEPGRFPQDEFAEALARDEAGSSRTALDEKLYEISRVGVQSVVSILDDHNIGPISAAQVVLFQAMAYWFDKRIDTPDGDSERAIIRIVAKERGESVGDEHIAETEDALREMLGVEVSLRDLAVLSDGIDDDRYEYVEYDLTDVIADAAARKIGEESGETSMSASESINLLFEDENEKENTKNGQ